MKTFNKDLDITAIQVDGKLGTKLVDPKRYPKEEDPYQSRKEVTVVFPLDDTSSLVFSGNKETIYEVLSTLKFTK